MPTIEVTERTTAEREELSWLLTSGALGRSSNLARMLAFICEKHFEGQAEQVKEYTIAVEALGRRPDFDPQRDTIVRVTAHSLRKRLQEIYQHDGAARSVHILIPAGRYCPLFVHEGTSSPAPEVVEPTRDSRPNLMQLALPEVAIVPEAPARRRVSRGMAFAGVGAGILLLLGFGIWANKIGLTASTAKFTPVPVIPLPVPPNTVRALLGNGRRTYVDRSGITWAAGNYCTGGDTVSLPKGEIIGSEDPYLYMGGVRGIAHCLFPAKPGDYEVHFHFAEMSDLAPATLPARISVNAIPDIRFDVVDDAGGDGIATSYVMTGVRPENDGFIHIDYVSEISPLNAVEILPAPDEKLLPVRIAAGSASISDGSGQLWLSDRYFSGGRWGRVPNRAKELLHGIYGSDRVGQFRYTIPAVPGAKYQVKLYFSEPWFGARNGGIGGVGSRVFDVSSNGNLLLKNFDITAEGGGDPVVKTFDNIEANPRGKIELSFIPVVNYPLLNAIEVLPEP